MLTTNLDINHSLHPGVEPRPRW